MRLIEPSLDFRNAFINMALDYVQNGEDRYGQALDEAFDFSVYINKLKCEAETPKNSDYAPSTTFWLVDNNDTILAVSRLRHCLVPRTEKEGGHIGYDVPPSLRRNGYGKLLLRLTLEKARELGLQRVLITCDSDNTASAGVISNNGGILESEIISEHSGKKVSRYWIELQTYL